MDPDFVNRYNQVLSRLKLVDNFDGNDPGKLPQFLHKIEVLMPTINTFDDYYRAQLLGHIKNKCTERARDAVFSRQMSAPAGGGRGGGGGGSVTGAESWHKLKEQLLHNFAERESSYALIHKIRSGVLDSNIELYYQKMAKLKQRLINRKLTHNDTLYSLEDIERIALQAFRDHLPEPTHSMILRRNPKTMEEAYRYIVEVQHQFYTQGGPLGCELGATFSTSHKQTYGIGSGVGLGLGIASVGLAGSAGSGGSFSYNRQMSDKGGNNGSNSSGSNNNSSSRSYYNQAAPPVGAGKTSPMFKSNGNPSFKSYSYNGSSSGLWNSGNSGSGSGSGGWSSNKQEKNKSKDQAKGGQYGQSMKMGSGSSWRK